MNCNAPIGVFDSGIGGLTVAAAIHNLLPNESLMYFGDTAHFPYGNQSPAQIEQYGRQIAQFLKDQGCKMIVIACNTASAHAFKSIVHDLQGQIPVVNVIDPASAAIAERFPQGKVGVIATQGTIRSGIYPRKIKRLSPSTQVTSLATPLLAPMIEEGFFNNKISRTVIHSYLDKKNLQDIDALILGCTHYPLIKKEVEEYYNKKVQVVDSAEWVAKEVRRQLNERNCFSAIEPKFEFYVSYLTPIFEKSARYFFPQKVVFQEKDIWQKKSDD